MQLLPNRWQTYMGILVESTLTKNQRTFHIYVPEFLPTKTGDVSTENGTFNLKMFNELTEVTEVSSIDITATIEADYFGAITTSMDVPTMYKGMQVLVLNYANNDKWYWLPLERDDSYKTFEHVRVHCADEAKTNKATTAKDDIATRNAGLTDDNTYYMEIDTKYQKHIMLSTAASDGEQWRYFFKIDAEAHTVELWDNCVDGSQPNNTIKIESRPNATTLGKITLQNASGNSIILQGQDMMINVPRNLVWNIGGDTLINRGGNYIENIVKDSATTIGGNESSTTVGTVNRIVKGDYVEVNGQNRSTTVVLSNTEKQLTRTTTSMNATWVSQSWSLTAQVGNFAVDTCSWVCITCSYQVAKAWSLVCKTWNEVASSIAGTVVSLIRGGHH